MKKKLLLLLGLSVLTTSILTACTAQTKPDKTNAEAVVTSEVVSEVVSEIPSEEIESEVASEEKLMGGWEVCPTFNEMLAEDEKEIFDSAVTDEDPVYVLATQVVSGMNRAYLTFDGTSYGVEVVYTDLEGNSKSTSCTKIDLADLKTVNPDKEDTPAVGGWEIQGTGKALMLPGAEIQDSFEQATKDTMLNPIALLGSQLVNGINYTAITLDKDNNLYFTTWYAPFEGDATLTSNEQVDLTAYINN